MLRIMLVVGHLAVACPESSLLPGVVRATQLPPLAWLFSSIRGVGVSFGSAMASSHWKLEKGGPKIALLFVRRPSGGVMRGQFRGRDCQYLGHAVHCQHAFSFNCLIEFVGFMEEGPIYAGI